MAELDQPTTQAEIVQNSARANLAGGWHENDHIYHVVRKCWHHDGKIVDTRITNWGSMLGLAGDRLRASNLVAEAFRRSGDPLIAIVEIGVQAFTIRSDIATCYRRYRAAGGGGLRLDQVMELVEELGRYRATFQSAMDGLRFRETIIEGVRVRFHRERPSRLASLFGDPSLASAALYLSECTAAPDPVRRRSLICTIEPRQLLDCFKADLQWIDEFENHSTFAETEALLRRYWGGEMKKEPRPELLLQGTLSYGPEVTPTEG